MDIELRIVRRIHTPKSTIGDLSLNNEFFCFTLEDTARYQGEKVKGKTAIPEGVYNVELTMSNRFKKVMPLLLNVEGFTGIRIHKGNYPEDTDGCILVGMTRDGEDSIQRSKVAYDMLMARLTKADKITLTII